MGYNEAYRTKRSDNGVTIILVLTHSSLEPLNYLSIVVIS